MSVQGQEQHLHAGLTADVAKTSPYYCQCKTNCGVSTTLCTMLDLEMKARLCMPSKPSNTFLHRNVSDKVNRKAWPITKVVVTTRENTGKGKLVTDSNKKPQTGVEKKTFYGKLPATGSL